MAKFFRSLILLTGLLAASPVFAQSTNVIVGAPPFTGTTIGNGQAITSPLFLAPNVNLQFGLPMSYAYWIKTTSIPRTGTTGGNTYILSSNPTSSGVGFLSISQNPTSALQSGFNQDISPQSSTAPQACDQASNGRMCSNNFFVNDGNWHHVCTSWGPLGGSLYIDAILRSTNPYAITYTPNTGYWQLGDTTKTPFTFRDIVTANAAFTGAQCANAYYRGISTSCSGQGCNLVGTDLLNNAVSYWPMNNCTGSGATFTCPDSIHSNNWITGQSPATMVITAPTGTITGITAFTATCTDTIGVSNVSLFLDGFQILTTGNAPYTLNFNTAALVDGVHTTSGTCTNFGGTVTTATPVTFTSSNGNTGNTYYVSDNSGSSTCNDANNGTSTSTPWCTTDRVNTGPTGGSSLYGPGDKILFGGGESWSIATTADQLIINGNSTGNGKHVNMVAAWGSSGITISTFNDGHGVSCAPPTTTTGCATFNVSIPSSASVGSTYNLYLFGAITLMNTNGPTVTNVRVVGSGTSQLYCCGNLAGILVASTTGSGALLGQWAGAVVSNSEVLDMNGLGGQIYLGQTSGAISNVTVSNNTVHVTTPSSTTNGSAIGISCYGACRTSTIEGNVVYNINGFPNTAVGPNPNNGYAGGCCGNGIAFLNGASHNTMQFNLVHDNGQNNNQCGGPVALYDFEGSSNTIQLNEAFNQLPINFPASPGCDNDAVDLDTTVNGDLVQYNYTHNNWGLVGGFVGTTSWGATAPNVFRFNISENDELSCGDRTCGLLGFGPDAGTVYAYNNTMYNNLNGTQSNGVNSSFVRTSGLAISCLSSSSIIANNIFAITTDHNGTNSFVYLQNGGTTWCPSGNTFKANDYYAISGSGNNQWVSAPSTSVTTLAGWQAVAVGGDTGATLANPTFSGTVGLGVQCITTTGSTGPGNCPANYALGGGSTLLGAAYTGLTAAPYNQTITRDYFNNACSGGNVRTIGAAGCQ